MAFNIENFKASGLPRGGVRPTLFQVQCTFPTVVNITDIDQGGRFVVSAAELPASLIDEIRIPYMGRSIKIAGDRTYQDWNVTVMMDEDYALRNAFEEWHNSINSIISNRMNEAVAGPVAGQASYKTDMIIQNFSKPGPGTEAGVIRQYRIVGAFPNTVSAVRMDWADNNRIATFDVSFSYDYWIPEEGTTRIYNPIQSPDSSVSLA